MGSRFAQDDLHKLQQPAQSLEAQKHGQANGPVEAGEVALLPAEELASYMSSMAAAKPREGQSHAALEDRGSLLLTGAYLCLERVLLWEQ